MVTTRDFDSMTDEQVVLLAQDTDSPALRTPFH